MPLPPRQVKILRYLGGDRKSATARNITRDLRLPRSAVRNALLELSGNRLVSPDHTTWPTSWVLTDFGAAVLDAEPEREPQ